MTSHQRKTSIAGQAFRFGSFLSRISVAPVILLGAGGSGVPSNNLRSRLRRLVLVFLPAMLTVILIAPSAPAASNGAPEINTFQINESSPKTFKKERQLFATRVEFGLVGNARNVLGAKTPVRVEYSRISADGPWTLGEEEVISKGEQLSSAYLIRYLAPATHYYARVVAENELGSAEAAAEFTTVPVSSPEITELTLARLNANDIEIGTTYANFVGHIETNGADTKYHFAYSTSQAGPWIPASGASGSVTVAEDYTEPEVALTGLKPETQYYLRGIAENEAGATSTEHGFKTIGLHPTATMDGAGIGDVTATSAHVAGTIETRSVETHWRFETASSASGPWSPVPSASGTISAAEASENSSTVHGVVSGLNPGTAYYVRFIAENEPEPSVHYSANSENEYDYSTDRLQGPVTFETAGPPRVSTYAVHTFAEDSETIRVLGSVDPDTAPVEGGPNYDTRYHFEYVGQKQFEQTGSEGSWGKAQSTPEVDLGPGELENGGYVSTIVAADLPGMQPGAAYRYRLTATNTTTGDPVVHGSEQTVTAPPISEPGLEGKCPNEALRTGPSAHLPDCRAYEQVTPMEKGGSPEIAEYGPSFVTPVFVGEDGDHFLLESQDVKWGPDPGSNESAYLFSRELAGGWGMSSATPQPESGANRYVTRLHNADLTLAAIEIGWTTIANSSPDLSLAVGPVGGPYTPVISIPRSQIPRPGGVDTEQAWVGASADFAKLVFQAEDRKLLGPPTGTASGPDLYEYAEDQVRQLNVDSAGVTIGSCGARVGQGERHAVSSDGSRVFFEAAPGSECSAPRHLYMRLNGTETVDLGEYLFIAGNAEGTKLLLSEPDGELVGYNTETRTPRSASPAELATAGELNALGVSSYAVDPEGALERGHDAYFVSRGVTGVPGGGKEPPDAHSSCTTGGCPSEQVYRYDSSEHIIQCMSCASAFNPEPKLLSLFANGEETGTGLGVDDVPEVTMASENGDEVFFDSLSALVPSDVDGEIDFEGEEYEGHSSFYYSPSSDVYEWRRDGINGCAHAQGCLSLISSGQGGHKVMLLGTTKSGHDVFFTTNAQLVGQDKDTSMDVYDARVDGGVAEAARPVECEGDACSTPFAAPNDLTPSSATFQGAGDALSAIVPQTQPKQKTNPRSKKRKAKKHNGKAKTGKKGQKRAEKSDRRDRRRGR
jgi:hypothetical protein